MGLITVFSLQDVEKINDTMCVEYSAQSMAHRLGSVNTDCIPVTVREGRMVPRPLGCCPASEAKGLRGQGFRGGLLACLTQF